MEKILANYIEICYKLDGRSFWLHI